MAEVGLRPFARVALQIAKATLPRYRSRFSKHQFTQPQLLAILCLAHEASSLPNVERERGASGECVPRCGERFRDASTGIGFDRERHLFGEAQTLGTSARSYVAHAKAAGSFARTEFQFVPPEASLSFREDINRAGSGLSSSAYAQFPPIKLRTRQLANSPWRRLFPVLALLKPTVGFSV